MSRTVIHTLDEAGRKVCLVSLGRNGEKGSAIIEEGDLSFMVNELGLSLRWNRIAKTGAVVAPAGNASGGSIQVSRVLLDLGPGENVRYLNSDPTDLRRENLAINYDGWATRRDRDYLTPKVNRKKWGPELKHIFKVNSKQVSKKEFERHNGFSYNR